MQILSQPLPNLKSPFLLLPIEGGHFHLGDEHGDLPEYCRPVHKVTISDFYLGKFPVTQALWKAVMNNGNPSRFQGDDRPVEQVSWNDTQEFIKQLNKLTQSSRPADHFYRLPTEAEWEYAARGGKYHAEGYKYAGSDRLKDVGWFNENSGNETKSVGLKYPNQLGLYDMSGNVWERCEDDWHNNYEGAPNDGKAWMDRPQRGSIRVDRGGSWGVDARYCRVSLRNNDFTPGGRIDVIGFRLASSPQ